MGDKEPWGTAIHRRPLRRLRNQPLRFFPGTKHHESNRGRGTVISS